LNKVGEWCVCTHTSSGMDALVRAAGAELYLCLGLGDEHQHQLSACFPWRACRHACACVRARACMHASERASTRARATWLVTVVGVADGAGGKQPPMHFGLHRRRVGLRRHLQPVVPRALWCSHAPRTRGAFPSSAWWTVRSGAGGRVSMRLPARARDLLHVLGRPRPRVLRCVQGTASVVTCAFFHPLLPAPDGHSDRELGSGAPCPSSAATPRAARR